MRALLIGYGNKGRLDDGLGPDFAARIEAMGIPGLDVDIDYQLTVEHAAMAAERDLVIFADALMGSAAPFEFMPVTPDLDANLGSHALQPPAVLALCQTLFGKAPRAFVIGISGRDFGEVGEGLSAEADANLTLAEQFFTKWFAGKTTAD